MFLHNSTILCYRGVYSSQIAMSAKIPEYVSAMLTWGMNGTNWHGRLDSTICCSLQLQTWVTVTGLWWAGSPLSQKKPSRPPGPDSLNHAFWNCESQPWDWMQKSWKSELCESEVLLTATPRPKPCWIYHSRLGLSTQHMPSVLHLWYDTVSAACSPQLRSKATDCYELPCV